MSQKRRRRYTSCSAPRWNSSLGYSLGYSAANFLELMLYRHLQIFVNSVERLNSPVYSAPPCISMSHWPSCDICVLLHGKRGCLQLLMNPMILSVLYIWCQFNKDQIVQFWFGTQFKVGLQSYTQWPKLDSAFSRALHRPGGPRPGWSECLTGRAGHLGPPKTLYTVSQKVPTFRLSVTLSNLNGFSKFMTAGKHTKFATKPVRHYHLTLGMLLHYLGKLNSQILVDI